MRNSHAQAGYLLASVVITLVACSFLTMAVYMRIATMKSSTRAYVKQAKLLYAAETGIAFSQSLLCGKALPENLRSECKDPVLASLFLACNTWHRYTLTRIGDDVLECGIFITCENSKINVNNFFKWPSLSAGNMKNAGSSGAPSPSNNTLASGQQAASWANPQLTKKFMQVIADHVSESGDSGKNEAVSADNLEKKFLEYAQKRSLPFTDLQQAFGWNHDEGAFASLWPPRPWFFVSSDSANQDTPSSSKKTLPPYWLWATVDSRTIGCNPFFLTQEVASLVGLGILDDKQKTTVAKNISRQVSLSQQWDSTLGLLYKTKFDQVRQEIKTLFASEFEALTFSVVSYARIGLSMQVVCAYVDVDISQDGKTATCSIKRIYVL